MYTIYGICIVGGLGPSVILVLVLVLVCRPRQVPAEDRETPESVNIEHAYNFFPLLFVRPCERST